MTREASDTLPEGLPLAAQPGEEVLLQRLLGVRFLTGEAGEGAAPVSAEAPISIAPGLEMLDDGEFLATLGAFIGKPASMNSLRRLAAATRLHLAASRSPFAVVYLPEQDITDGVVTLRVAPSRLGEVLVEGNCLFSDDDYRRWLRAVPGEAIDARRLGEDIDWINRNPFRQLTPTVTRGQAPGTTDLVLRAREAPRAWSAFAGFNNHGTVTSDEQRLFLGVNWGDAFGRGDLLDLNLSADPAADHFRALSASYQGFLPWRHVAEPWGSYSTTDGIVAPPFSLDGSAWRLGFDYGIPDGAGQCH